MANRDNMASRLILGADSSAFSAARSPTSSVASTSTQTVASGISRRDRLSLSATALRTPRIGIRATLVGARGRDAAAGRGPAGLVSGRR